MTESIEPTEPTADATPKEVGLSLDQQIKELEGKLEQLENMRLKTVVEELEFDAPKLALVAADRAEYRYKRAWTEGQKLIKQCAWSGLRRVQLDSSVPIMNASFVHDLHQAGFKAKVVTTNGVEKIEVRW